MDNRTALAATMHDKDQARQTRWINGLTPAFALSVLTSTFNAWPKKLYGDESLLRLADKLSLRMS